MIKVSANVLIVDDHPGIRLLLLEIFKHEGYNVSVVSTGKEAIETLATHSFDIVLLDKNLPIINGIEVIECLHHYKIDVNVILMSGLVDDLEEKVKQYEFVRGIKQKPFDITDLCDTVKEIIKNDIK